jgi:uncharacterized phage infection (PIP) family protein YhgE
MSIEDSFRKMKAAYEAVFNSDNAKTTQIKELAEKLEAANAMVNESDKQVASHMEQIKALTEELAAAKQIAMEFEKIKTDAEAIANQIKAEQTTVGKKAAEMAASVGVQPVELSPAVSHSASDEDIVEKWIDMKKTDAKAASQFYDKNRAAILRKAGIR